jgi:uncharacterized protein (DUF983 family)
VSDFNGEFSFRKVRLYLGRAMLLCCPVCGKHPIFSPALRTRSLRDWFAPLDGCPRCGYPYEREPGYFLASTWVINYGAGSILGIVIYVILDFTTHLPIGLLLTAVLTPIVLFNLLFARYSKSLFIAIDHLSDPHEKDPGDEGGNLPKPEAPTRDSGGPSKPTPKPNPIPGPESEVAHH